MMREQTRWAGLSYYANDEHPKMAYSKGNFRPRHDDVIVPVQLAPASWRCSYDELTEVLGNHAHDQQSGPSRACV